jgi:uncharacterized protein (TIGR03067 family)
VKKDSKDKKPTADAKGNKGKGKEKDNTDPVTPTGGSGSMSLEGTWEMVGAEVDGDKLAPNELPGTEKDRTIQVTKDKWGDAAGKHTYDYKLDTSKTPATLDLLGPDRKLYGIVKVEGDTMTTMMGGKSDARPKEFKTMKGAPGMLSIYKKK